MRLAGQILTVTISDLAFGGDGIARLDDGAVVFIPFTAIGDVAEVEIISVQKTLLRARLQRLLTAGPGRTTPVCRHYGVCGGCVYQHLDYETECAAKQQQLLDTIKRLGKLSSFPPLSPVVPSPMEYGYRNKIRLEPGTPVKSDHGFELQYGYFQFDNQTLLPIRQCPLAMDSLNQLLPKAFRSPWARQNAKRPKPFTLTLRAPARDEPLFYFGYAPQKMTWAQEEVNGQVVRVPVGSFWQVNPPVAEQLINTVVEWFEQTGARSLIDAYGGVGTFSLAIGNKAQFRVIVENDPQAVEVARYNHAQQSLKAKIVEATTEMALPKILTQVNNAETTVILDPPRTGCQPKVIQTIRNFKPANVIYVSCNAATLARDLKILCQDGLYHPVKAGWFDMFPKTAHFESAVLLQKETEKA